MDEKKWISWKIQTSKKWSDLEDVLKSTNIEVFDFDHMMLIKYALRLNHVIDKAEVEFTISLINETKDLLNDMYKYAELHFKREEVFMDLYCLPNSEAHKREHSRILEAIAEEIDKFDSGKVKLSGKLKTLIMDWVVKHINTIDFEFFDIKNWSSNIINATQWDDVKPIIHMTGIQAIDEQHMEMTILTLETIRNLVSETKEEAIAEQFDKVIQYAKHHFQYEEEFIKKYSIQDTDEHLKMHNYFIEKIREYCNAFKAGDSKLEELKVRVLTWWISHINDMDKETFAYSKWANQLVEQTEDIDDIKVILRWTGIEEIDNDHVNLMKLTLSLNNHAKNECSRKEEIIELLDKIYACSVEHFKREEKMMKQHKIEGYDNHREEHAEILRKLEGIKNNYLAGRLFMSSNIKSMILQWWLQHTNTTDYRTFVHNYHPRISSEHKTRIGKGEA